MKQLFIILSLLFISCSSEEAPTKEQPNVITCYKIVQVSDTPTYDYIVIELEPNQYETYQVPDYREYIRKTQICDLSTLKKL